MVARIHVLGTAVLDRVYFVDRLPGHDEKAFATRRELTVGGPGAYVASAVAALGGAAHLHSITGDDAAGQRLREVLQARGVDIAGVGRQAGFATPENVIIVDLTGEKSVVIEPVPEGVLAEVGAGLQVAVGDGLITHLFHPVAVSRATVRARDAGARVLVDLEVPEVERFGLEAAISATAAAGVICTNEQMLTTFGVEPTPEAAVRFARRIAPAGATVFVTLGVRGAVLIADAECLLISALPVRAPNTTGAGDCFIAALGRALCEGHATVEAARVAVAAAGLFLVGALDWDTAQRRAGELTITRVTGDDG